MLVCNAGATFETQPVGLPHPFEMKEERLDLHALLKHLKKQAKYMKWQHSKLDMRRWKTAISQRQGEPSDYPAYHLRKSPGWGAGRGMSDRASISPSWGDRAGVPGSEGARLWVRVLAGSSAGVPTLFSQVLVTACVWGNYLRPGKEPHERSEGAVSTAKRGQE